MKKISLLIAALVVCAFGASAQYYSIASQLPSLISPALSGSVNYKGYVELGGTAGLGHNRVNDVGISTSQGFRYADWFFMGVGLGVDMLVGPETEWDGRQNSRQTKCMIPAFTDFRFNVGDTSKISFFTDVKIGATWIMGDRMELPDGLMTAGTQFYLKPQVGVRIPVNSQKPAQAFNVGLTYQLITGNDNVYSYYGYGLYDNYRTVSLSNLGLTLSFEW
ncbi:MAG: hypothetical protein ACI30O_05515 [Muribaculaceae bacterium]